MTDPKKIDPKKIDRAVVVTGAFGALGRVVAQTFADSGARVALINHSASVPAEVAARFGAPHLIVGGVDLTDEQATTAAMSRIRGELGRIDVLVNAAGGFRWEKLENGGAAAWDAMYSTNLRTAVVATRAALPHLLARAPGSRIINVAAGAAAKAATAGMGAYAASKAGVIKLTESLSDEVKDRGLTVNCVLPGTIDTPANRREMPDADVSRWVSPEQIAAAIVFLAGDSASGVTGAAIPVTGRG